MLMEAEEKKWGNSICRSAILVFYTHAQGSIRRWQRRGVIEKDFGNNNKRANALQRHHFTSLSGHSTGQFYKYPPYRNRYVEFPLYSPGL